MPTCALPDLDLYYETRGSGPRLLLFNGSGSSIESSEPLIDALAKHCEALGYSRYWCAEHHNSAAQAGTAPEILISAIAATTSRIRV